MWPERDVKLETCDFATQRIVRNFVCRKTWSVPQQLGPSGPHHPHINVHREKNLKIKIISFRKLNFEPANQNWIVTGKTRLQRGEKDRLNVCPLTFTLLSSKLRRFNSNNSTSNSFVHIFKTLSVTQNVFKLIQINFDKLFVINPNTLPPTPSEKFPVGFPTFLSCRKINSCISPTSRGRSVLTKSYLFKIGAGFYTFNRNISGPLGLKPSPSVLR